MATISEAQCTVCKGRRVCCPGCSGFTEKYPKLRMGCGVLIRCPKCVGRKDASMDKGFMEMFYYSTDSNSNRIVNSYYDKMRMELQTRFPAESFDDL